MVRVGTRSVLVSPTLSRETALYLESYFRTHHIDSIGEDASLVKYLRLPEEKRLSIFRCWQEYLKKFVEK